MTAELLNTLKIVAFIVSVICIILFLFFVKRDMDTEEQKPKREWHTSLTYPCRTDAESVHRRQYRLQIFEKAQKEKIRKLTAYKPEVPAVNAEQNEMDKLRASWRREKEKREEFKGEQAQKNK